MTNSSLNRREFVKSAVLSAGALALGRGLQPSAFAADISPFKISLAQWSLHRMLKEGKLDNLDYPKYTKENFGIDAVEWVNQFFYDQVKDQAYLDTMKKRCEDHGVKSVLIMCDRIGNLGNPDAAERTKAVEGHYAWVDAAKFLECHSIRVNARSDDKLTAAEQHKYCVDGLRRLSEFAKPHGLGVIVENHGGLSSDGAWLAGVMKEVGMDNCGTLPDFGNFYLVKNRGNQEAYEKAKANFADTSKYIESEAGLEFDRYKGIELLMPYAKGVSAKSHDFNEAGEEIHTDFMKAMKIVKDAGYQGYVGIEYEGSTLSEPDGIMATKKLLEKVFAELA